MTSTLTTSIASLSTYRAAQLPRFLQSGTVLAIVTGVALVVAQLCWLALLNEASVAMEGAYQALQATRR